MNVLAFLRENARWLALGFLLLFFGAVGQTYFLAMSVGDLRRELGLSHSAFSGLYMAATLISAFTLPHLGGLLDRHAPHRVVACVVPMLALAAAALALSTHWAAVFLALIGLRLFGQGLMAQTAFNVLGRWFAAERGRAVSIATLGFNGGQALLPAALLTDEPLTLRNLPRLADVDTFGHLLNQFGASTHVHGSRPEDFGRVMTVAANR
ncbi:MAG: MFS transporter, partial [Aquincola tertiaricarbonis]